MSFVYAITARFVVAEQAFIFVGIYSSVSTWRQGLSSSRISGSP